MFRLLPLEPRIKQTRLKAACALAEAHIKCLVWGTDALAYIYFIPTGLFALHLAVADKEVQQASAEIMESLPYKVCTSIPDSYLNSFFSIQIGQRNSRTQFASNRQVPLTNATLTIQRSS